VQEGVPVVPGITLEGVDPERVAQGVSEVGYPLLIKAAGGGGGRGMRKVYAPAQLDEALKGAAREATAFFGRSEVFIERLIERARHIEVQAFGDRYGNVRCLSDRDCTMQRSHQKVIEEGPAPGVSQGTRDKLHRFTAQIFRAAKYCGAGTAEFLLLPDGTIYFLEVNSRLQVEHPVTEAIMGMDLVALQLKIADGFDLNDLPPREPQGAAVELRICAEDPRSGFRPSTGVLRRFHLPELDVWPCTIRVDTGVSEGDRISHHYDSLIAKLIVHGPTRDHVTTVARRALDRLEIAGIITNVPFLADLLESDAYQHLEHHTTFAETLLPTLEENGRRDDEAVVARALFDLATPDLPGAWNRARGFSTTGSVPVTLHYTAAGNLAYSVTATPLASHAPRHRIDGCRDAWEITIDTGTQQRTYRITGLKRSGSVLTFHRGPAPFQAHLVAPDWIRIGSVTTSVIRRTPTLARRNESGEISSGTVLAATLPGKVLEVKVQPGDAVKKGETLVVLESMKMEHPLPAPADGTVHEVLVKAGAVVETNAPLVKLAVDQSPREDP
jgi:acetyl/propionyl-CoA carboxylase alpha subunit